MVDPLEALLRPLAHYLNRTIAEVTPARERCSELDGKTVAVRLHGTGLAAYFVFAGDAVALATDTNGEPDVVITGSLLTLAGMINSDGAEAIRQGRVDLTGDAEAAAAFQALLEHSKPDIEEELSALIGDVAAHRLGELARGVRDWSRQAHSTLRQNLREYLQEESRDVPSRYEVERFTRAVDTLRDDVERLEARIDRLTGH